MRIVGLTALSICFALFFYTWLGGTSGVSSVELNALCHACLALWALVVGVLMIVFYRHESDPVTGSFAWVESRKRNPRKWLLSGFVVVPGGAFLAWLVAYIALATMNTNLPGPTIQIDAEIASPTSYGSYGEWCAITKVRLGNGATHWICTRRPFGDFVPANARCAAEGSRARVGEVTTALGKTLALLSIDSPAC